MSLLADEIANELFSGDDDDDDDEEDEKEREEEEDDRQHLKAQTGFGGANPNAYPVAHDTPQPPQPPQGAGQPAQTFTSQVAQGGSQGPQAVEGGPLGGASASLQEKWTEGSGAAATTQTKAANPAPSLPPAKRRKRALEHDEELLLMTLPVIPAETREARKDQKQRIIKSLTPEQLTRYDAFKKSRLPTKTIKKMLEVLGFKSPPSVPVVLAGVAKMFIGQVVEEARLVQRDWNHGTGPLEAAHLREAHRRLLQRGHIVGAPAPRLFKRR